MTEPACPVAWIRTIGVSEATGPLKRQYEAAVKRAGKVFHILQVSSLRPEVLRPFIEVYRRLMHGPSGLSRARREMIAVVVSVANGCHY